MHSYILSTHVKYCQTHDNQSQHKDLIIMAALRSTCGHYIFVLFLLLLFSSPNLSGRRLDVYHRPTSTHGVAPARI